MIGLVLIGHTRIASEMKRALEFVVGEQVLMEAVDATEDMTPESLAEKLHQKIRSCDIGKGVLVLADMFGGTPCNVAMGALEPGRVEVVSGFNLPLLIKAVSMRTQVAGVSELANHVVRAGRQYIQVAPKISISGTDRDHAIAPECPDA